MIQRILLFAAIVLLTSGVSRSAEVVLREQAAPVGPIVRLGDLADVTADGESAAEVLAATPLMTTPAAGERRFLRASQVRDMLSASGVNVRELTFAGAAAVAINGAATDAPLDDEGALSPAADRTAVADQLAADIVAYLRQQTGHNLWEVRIVTDRDMTDVRRQHGVPATVAGGKAPWTGRQRFTLTWPTNTRGVPVTADVARIEMAAFAVRAIERGDLVRATDLELRPHAGALPGKVVASLEDAVGQEAVQTIRAGAVVLSSQLRPALLVRRGDRVSVRARAGGVTVRTYATAQQDGSLGDLLMVSPIDSREKFVARVSGVRELEVFAGGAAAGDVAAFSH